MLSEPCHVLPGVGAQLSKQLAKCGIVTLRDLLLHLPFRYQDRTRVTPIRDLRAQDWAVVVGQISHVEIKKGRRKILECYVEDKTGLLKLRFFHFHAAQLKAFEEHKQIRLFGEVRAFSAIPEMIHPEYALQEGETPIQVEEALTPIYSSTQGLSQHRIRALVKKALMIAKEVLQSMEWMPEQLLKQLQVCRFSEALHDLHFPPPETRLVSLEEGNHPALKRLILEELLAERLGMQFAKVERKRLFAPSCVQTALIETFLEKLPFSLTRAQKRVREEIAADLVQTKPMLRLVQGDVGSGKTVVAAMAALQVIESGYQVALMAPTDLLSEQHALTLGKWFAELGIEVKRLNGKMSTSARKQSLDALKMGACQCLIGTHALFQEKVEFKHLGLIIIDEQHRFGVEQRLALEQKGRVGEQAAHQLLMTATPIPRTLRMTQWAHLDVSIIDELPPSRTPVITAVMPQEKRFEVLHRLQEAISEGRQVYWVCTLIEESEQLQCQAASVTAEDLIKALPEVRVGLIHGKLKADEKEAVITLFRAGEIDLLVATTVIEVGVDVPNASLMIIENAERLGLAQLHQLRGRVGRGATQSYCILLYQSPLSEIGVERLKMMRESNDGFEIAEKDLALRGAGEILGTRQTGYRHYKVAQLARDKHLLPIVAKLAEKLVVRSEETAREIVSRWLGEVEEFLRG